ncbi:MAG: hypothetical protein ACLSIK_04475 [Enterocloster clostridioformis]|uniref:hypothetical protein n=1 Tax=Enterocloster clostridioformis TaxID=1531 RepID=UPI0039925D44
MLIALLKVGRLEMKFRKMNLAALLLVVGLSAGTLSGCGKEAPAAAAADIAREAGSQAEDRQTEDGQTGDRQTEDRQTEDRQTGDDPAERARAGDTGSQETGSRMDVAQDGMVPVLADAIKDGVYGIKVDSSSSMFQITECELTVRDGAMSAVMTMSGTGYLKLYMGTGADAERAPDADFIPFAENADGKHTFKVPVEALDKGIDCSAFSKKREKWYDRVLVFRADSLPAEAFADGKVAAAESLKLEDGSYTVAVRLEGGSGRASVETPAALRIEDGKAFATIIWSSSNDYMKVGGEKFDLVNTEGNSSFEIPVSAFDWKMQVIADTIAMSEPHEVEYTLVFDSTTIKRAE